MLIQAGEWARAIIAVVSVLGMIAGAMTHPIVRGWVASAYGLAETGGPCLSIPAYDASRSDSHVIEPAAPGEWATVTWRKIVRYRDNCGAPIAIGIMSNGDNIRHRVELSIGKGVVLGKGVHDLRYRFRIPSDVSPGRAFFNVAVTFPDAVGGAGSVISDEIPFEILDPNRRRGDAQD